MNWGLKFYESFGIKCMLTIGEFGDVLFLTLCCQPNITF